MNFKKLSFAVLQSVIAKVGAEDIEDITIEQVTQLHNASDISEKVTSIVEEIKAAAKQGIESERATIIDQLSNIDIALTTLCGSLNIGKTELSKASLAKITANNQPKKAPAKRTTKDEKQIDIEDRPAKEASAGR